MTEEDRDKGLENLFRNKLKENEVAAGNDLTARFMRRLGRREFLRFNPTRINIYYIAITAAGLAVTGLLLLAGPRNEDKKLPRQHEIPEKEVISETGTTEIMSSEVAVASTVAVTTPDGSGAGKAETAPAGVTERYESLDTPAGQPAASVTVSTMAPEDYTLKTSRPVMAIIEPSATSGCVPLHIRFRSNAGDQYTPSWQFGDGGSSSMAETDYIYDLPGTYHVILTLTGSRGRTSTTETVIEAYGKPRADFEIRLADHPGEKEKAQFVNLSTEAVDYLWDFGDGTFSTLASPSYRYDRPGSYDVTLVAYSDYGCTDTMVVADAFTDRGMYLRFPNVVVPNKGGPTGGYYNQRTDEDNQVFHPVASGVASYNLKIYSKAGLLIFESSDMAMGWDGYYKGELCAAGVYVWKVRGTYRNGEPIIMAGDVTLLTY
jgi:PKD repeat protein